MQKLIVVIFTLSFFSCINHLQADSDCSLADSAINKVVEIRGLVLKNRVACTSQDKNFVRKYISKQIDKDYTKIAIEFEESIYKALGLLPVEFNFKEDLLSIYLSQIGGYYDPEKKQYVMASWMPEILQETTAVHELTHALQDQYFNLENFLKNKVLTSDETMARAALIEGDATAVMYDHTRKLFGQEPLSDLKSIDSILFQQVLGIMLTPELSTAPESIKFSMLFPYTSGLRFAHALLRSGGYNKINEAFTDPPSTTEQILHPELYLNKTKSTYRDVTPSEVLKEFNFSDQKIIKSDVLGEFVWSIVLGQGNQDKAKKALAAAGWAGDRIILLDSKEKRYVLALVAWDTKDDADEFIKEFMQTLNIRFKTKILSPTSQVKWIELNDKKYHQITISVKDKIVLFGISTKHKT
jgi:hypothetical protein